MITGRHIKTARAALGLGVRELAAMAGVSLNTVSHFERGGMAMSGTVTKLTAVLEAEGIEFLNTGSPGIRWRD